MEFCVFYDDQSDEEKCGEESNEIAEEMPVLECINLEPREENPSQDLIVGLLDKGITELRDKNYSWPISLKLHRLYNTNLPNILLKASYQPSLVHDIMSENYFKFDIVFKNLTILNLGNLSSKKVVIQLLTLNPSPKFTFPSLKLYSFQNNCLSIKPIAKANFKNLTTFNFPQGQIKSLKGIQRCEIPHFKEIYGYDNKMLFFFQLFKLQAPKMEWILMGDQMESKLYSKYAYALGKKYKNCNF